MSATFRTIADELVAALAGATFSQSISPSLTRLADRSLPDLATLSIAVVRQSVTLLPGDRAGAMANYRLNVVIEKKIDRQATEATAIDPLEDLAEEILDFIQGTALTTVDAPIACEHDPIYDPDALRERHTFASVISPTYALLRTQP